MRARWTTIVILAFVAVLSTNAASALAATEAPGWELYANTYPTNFGQAVDEVQEINVLGATGGTFAVSIEENGAEQETAPIPYPASAGAVEAALEELPGIGGAGGHVGVTGGPEHFVVTYSGPLGHKLVASLTAKGGELTGPEPSAEAVVVTSGAASGTIGITVFNVGAKGSKGTISVTDRLPANVKAKEAGALTRAGRFEGGMFGVAPALEQGIWDCTGNGPGAPPAVDGASVVTCVNDGTNLASFAGGGGLPTLGHREELANPQPGIGIAVEATTAVSEPQHTTCVGEPAYCNQVSITGGGAAEPARTENPVTVSEEAPKGGLVSADAWFSNADGTTDQQAGSHPYTATFAFTVATGLNKEKEGRIVGSEIRGLETDVPPGLVGDLHNMPQCKQSELLKEVCPPDTIVGNLEAPTFLTPISKQIFNMVPPPGTPAELGFVSESIVALIHFSVKSGGDYRVVARVDSLPQRINYQTILTLWGTPEEASHDPWRGRGGEGGCTQEEIETAPPLETVDYCTRQQHPLVQPFLTLPTACEGPQSFAFRELSGWQEPAAKSEVQFLSHDAGGTAAGFTGCEALGFEPSISLAPDTPKADAAAGLVTEVKPTIGGLETQGALGTADIRDTTVTLPEGIVVNPEQAAGLRACPQGRPGPGREGDALTTTEERVKGEEDDEAANCSKAAKLGTATIKTPLLESASETELDGNVYLLQSNPPEIKLLIAASADGVNVKLPGVVHLDEATGRLQATFTDTPQLPFSDLKLSFTGNAQQALTTPSHCGVYIADANFTPWSAPLSANVLDDPSFAITEGPGGSPCPSSPLPLAPSLTAGSLNDQAGGFTGFSALLQRGDGQQRVETIQLKTPPGFAGMISSVALCGEPQARAGTCSAASQVGHAIVTAGPGANPLTIPQPGEPEVPIYLTGPYKGAPFGLSIATPVIAGPFNLGTIVTRAKVEVDPHTARVTVATDPLPQIVKGVPTDLRSIYAVIDRPNFAFNPTNCEPQESSALVTGTGVPGASEPGQAAVASSRFAVGGCRGLGFRPTLSVSTGAKTSRLNGASLKFKITYPRGSFSKQAWFREAKFVFPKQLPARLPTLHQACDATIFETSRASCPKHSVIGHAVVHTPVLPVPLEGSVYFVSHKNAAFPDAVMVLTGDNVTVELKGETLIRNGITSATFRGLPDVPFETFEVTLPAGEFSEFGGFLPAKAHESFCGQNLKMPTLLVAQNGLEVSKSTQIAVTGCRKAHKHHAKKTRGKKKH